MSKITLIVGDSSDIYRVTHEGVTDYTDYSGTLVILDNNNAEVLRKKVTPNITTGFDFKLAPDDTIGLPAATYKMAFEIKRIVASNVVFRRELHYDLVLIAGRVV